MNVHSFALCLCALSLVSGCRRTAIPCREETQALYREVFEEICRAGFGDLDRFVAEFEKEKSGYGSALTSFFSIQPGYGGIAADPQGCVLHSISVFDLDEDSAAALRSGVGILDGQYGRMYLVRFTFTSGGQEETLYMYFAQYGKRMVLVPPDAEKVRTPEQLRKQARAGALLCVWGGEPSTP